MLHDRVVVVVRGTVSTVYWSDDAPISTSALWRAQAAAAVANNNERAPPDRQVRHPPR